MMRKINRIAATLIMKGFNTFYSDSKEFMMENTIEKLLSIKSVNIVCNVTKSMSIE